MSRQLISRAAQTFNGRAVYGPYQADKPGYQCYLLTQFKPVCAIAAAFTAGLAAGASSGTLSAVWAGPTGLYPITFSDGETLQGQFLNGSAAVTFWGASNPTIGGARTVGVLVNAVTASITVGGQPVQAASANAVALSQSINPGTPATLNGAAVVSGAAVFDVPRNVVGAWTGAAIMTVTGTDAYGQPQTESSASGTVFTGKKAFATVTAVNVNAAVTLATVGTGKVLGLPFAAVSGDIALAAFADAADAGAFVPGDPTPASSTTGDVRGTYAPAGTPNGIAFLSLYFKPADPTSQVGTFGVTPA